MGKKRSKTHTRSEMGLADKVLVGAPDVGKNTFGIVAIDPTSPFTYGACVDSYPSHAISLNHFANEQIVAEMEGLLV